MSKVVLLSLLGWFWAVFPVLAQSQESSPFRAGGAVLRGAPAPPSGPVSPLGLPATPARAGTFRVVVAQMTSQMAFGQPVDQLRSFPRTQESIIAWVKYAGGAAGRRVTGRLLYLPPGKEIEAYRLDAPAEKGEGTLSFRFSAPPERWPVGKYRFEFLLDGAPLHAIRFEVRGQ